MAATWNRVVFVLCIGCGGPATLEPDSKWPVVGRDTGESDDDGPDTAEPEPDEPDDPPADTGTPVPALEGFIGSPCSADADCDYDEGVCLTDGFPEGMCSMACDEYCPDEEGYPVTFCVDTDDLPPGAAVLGASACVSRCHFGPYPDHGCRTRYGCTVDARVGGVSIETYVCIPGGEDDLSACHYELADRGVGFEPTIRQPEHPEGDSSLTCEVEDAVYLQSPVLGVDLLYYDGSPTPRTLAACEMAHALADTIEDVADYGVDELYHIGTYNCRKIGGYDVLSRHSFADAIDIFGFGFLDGRYWTLVDDWEHDTSTPESEASSFLYDAAYRWYDDWIWDTILTPNYNVGHDNHFHVDLDPGTHFVGVREDRYIGPAPYVD